MAYVVTEYCIGQNCHHCVDVCPEDCFYFVPRAVYLRGIGFILAGTDDENDTGIGMLMIHPDQCTDCGGCETECPVEAIYEQSSVPNDSSSFIQANAVITRGMGHPEQQKRRFRKS